MILPLKEVNQMDFDVMIMLTFAEILMDMETPDTLKGLRLDALERLQRNLNHYDRLGYIPQLINAIAEKKCRMIKEATSKAQIQSFIKPRCPHYDGTKFIEDPNIIPEEELICWSYASLRFPLNSIGAARFQEVFRRVFPEGVCRDMHESEAGND